MGFRPVEVVMSQIRIEWSAEPETRYGGCRERV
jgi:hypothetical protein